ncbi:MAG TPA: Crp/Fnr family transcriptional regulator [Thermoleophilaceae bacterium]|nr:Crp/Fnr family transcriptional regulator [Thermoleophilaceae bacterium]
MRPTVRNPSVRVLAVDRELGLRIPPEQVAEARRRLVAPLRRFSPGVSEVPANGARGHLGYLVLDGVIARELLLAGNVSSELLGEGDVVEPPSASEDALVHYRVFWHVLSPARLAVLDASFARTAGEWPQVIATLLERVVRRTMRMEVHQALLQLTPVETRLLVLFWHLAERWGRVTPRGIVLPLVLTHQVLGQLVGSRRASVTTALKAVIASGLVKRLPDGGWLLLGDPPDELSHLHWEHSPT